MNRVLFIFIDGVGIGEKDPAKNPFFRHGFKTFKELFGEIPSLDNPALNNGEMILKPVDARLGVEGLPQSGTGQSAIFGGFNAPQKAGKHFGPFPPASVTGELKKKNIFRAVLQKGLKPTFVNAYPKIFFDYVNSGKQRLSATTMTCLMSGVPLYKAADLWNGQALSAEIDNSRWRSKLNYKVPEVTPELAANRLLRISSRYDFTMFEYFLTDHAGHFRIRDEEMTAMLSTLDRFLYSVLTGFDSKNTTVIICSDHGNFEDLSVKTHTLNPSLFIAAGRAAQRAGSRIENLTQIKPEVMKLLR